jgi:DNA segregation ATPase FtsK/SpoIIIE, S-DNA-T family
MLRIQTTANTKSKEPLSPKFSRLLREAWWIAALLLGSYVALILLTYNKGDASWSHSGVHATVLNKGGDVGAWLADLLLYLFGLSAWWLVGLALFAIWRSYHRIETTPLTDKRPLYISLGGFVVLLLASSGMETLRMYTLQVPLPMAPGGVFGAVLGMGLG